MALTGWKTPGTAASVARAGSDGNWANPNNAKADDGSYASVVIVKESYSNWLRLTNFGFAVGDVPSGATVDGIEVKVERYSSGANINDSAIYLRDSGGQTGDNKASAANWYLGSPGEVVTYGGAADDWNAGLSDAEVRSSDFGVDISAYNLSEWSSLTARIDCVWIRIHYTAAGVDHEKALSDTVAISDSIVKGIGLYKTDAAAISDSLAKGIGLFKADSVALADAIVKAVSLGKADTVTISDAFAKVSTYIRAFADTVTIADDLKKAISLGKADVLAIADTVAKRVALVKANTVTIADTIAKAMGLLKADTMAIADTHAKTIGLGKSDTVTITDTFARVVAYIKALADTVTIADSISKRLSKVLSDTMALADSFAWHWGFGYTLSLSDVVTITDRLVGELRVKTYFKQRIARMEVKGMDIAKMSIKKMGVDKMPVFRWIIRRWTA